MVLWRKFDDHDRRLLEWLINGRTGLSSECMAATFLGVNPKRVSHPLDPSDFNRCLLLLEAVPECRSRLNELSKMSNCWNSLVDNWDDVEATFLNEAGLDWSKQMKAPKTYDLMKSLGL